MSGCVGCRNERIGLRADRTSQFLGWAMALIFAAMLLTVASVLSIAVPAFAKVTALKITKDETISVGERKVRRLAGVIMGTAARSPFTPGEPFPALQR